MLLPGDRWHTSSACTCACTLALLFVNSLILCRLQLRAFKLALQQLESSQHSITGLKLVLVGGCRNQADSDRAAALATLAEELGISEHVQLMVNAPFSDVVGVLGASLVGLHSMIDEHFGISVVEYLAAGCIPVAHDSGVPSLSY
jgi:alpha-1,2-mannosyltransferase